MRPSNFIPPLLLTLLLLTASCDFWHREEEYLSLLETPATLEQKTVSFVIPPGASTRTIATRLAVKGLIPAEWAFESYVSREGLSGRLQAGTFTLPGNATIPEIVEIIAYGQRQGLKITIPEGYRLTQIDALFASQGLISRGDLLNLTPSSLSSNLLQNLTSSTNLEGYLYPDTYFFDPQKDTPTTIASRLVGTLENKLTPEILSEVEKSDYTLHELLTLASLIERESRTSEERTIISGILHNRLSSGTPLGVDATVQYLVSDDWVSSLTAADLAINDPYNTRLHPGLPPGPICSPSFDSFLAALRPAQTDYYYYLHDPEGNIHYARTNAEHNQNKRLHLLP